MSQKKMTPPPMRKLVLLKLKMQRLLPKVKQLARSALSVVLIGSAFSYLVIKAPEMHGMYLRNAVDDKVYMIKGHMRGGGGTGFAIHAPSGQNYIVTNSHVCEGALTQSEDKTSLLVVKDDGSWMRRRILEVSDFTDLCLLEGMPGVEGLTLGSEPNIGETTYVVGHPDLRPMSISKGEVVARQDVDVFAYVLPGNPFLDSMAPHLVRNAQCDLPKNQLKEDAETNIGLVKVCYNVTKASYMTTILIFPGNSGSPMLSWTGALQGVAFASDRTNWALVVSLADLTKFISRY